MPRNPTAECGAEYHRFGLIHDCSKIGKVDYRLGSADAISFTGAATHTLQRAWYTCFDVGAASPKANNWPQRLRTVGGMPK